MCVFMAICRRQLSTGLVCVPSRSPQYSTTSYVALSPITLTVACVWVWGHTWITWIEYEARRHTSMWSKRTYAFEPLNWWPWVDCLEGSESFLCWRHARSTKHVLRKERAFCFDSSPKPNKRTTPPCSKSSPTKCRRRCHKLPMAYRPRCCRLKRQSRLKHQSLGEYFCTKRCCWNDFVLWEVIACNCIEYAYTVKNVNGKFQLSVRICTLFWSAQIFGGSNYGKLECLHIADNFLFIIVLIYCCCWLSCAYFRATGFHKIVLHSL